MKESLKFLLNLAFCTVLAFGLAACGGGGGGDAVIPPPGNSAPVADAGTDQSVLAGQTFNLDSSGCTDPNQGDVLDYHWELITYPSGGNYAFWNDVPNPALTLTVEGIYIFSLVVNDGKVDSAIDTVTVTVSIGNAPPVANAGPDQGVLVDDTVYLDGTGSTDANPGDTLTYSWSFIVNPGSDSLTGADTDSPSFTPSAEGDYVLSLVVNDGTVDSSVNTVTIAVAAANVDPVANAGPDQSVLTGNLVTLDGSGSTDDNPGDTLTYTWSFTANPGGDSLTGADTDSPSFTPSVDGDYVLSLVVNDGTVDSAADSVIITAGNATPAANAGPDQDALTGDTVTLVGTGSTDDNPADTLTYSWSFTTNPGSATLSGADTDSPTFTPDVGGTYEISLVVNDGTVDSAADSVVVNVNVHHGLLDTTFGTSGVVFNDVGNYDYGEDVAVQSDGKILVAGYANLNLVVLRYNSDGTPDNTFGTSGTAVYDSGDADYGMSIAIQSDGKILVAGRVGTATGWDILLVRFTSSGALDTTFSTDGAVTWDSGNNDEGEAVALQADGKILVTGYSSNGTDYDLALWRFTSAGALDATFNTDGIVIYDSGKDDLGYSVDVQADGGILVAGFSSFSSFSSTADMAIWRFTSAGALDTSFSTDGIAGYNGGQDDIGRAVALQADGKILLVGYSWYGSVADIVIMRFNSDGSADSTFSSDGLFGYNSGESELAFDVAVQSDGRILVAGWIDDGTDYDVLLVSFNSNGTLDTSFGTDGATSWDSGLDDYGNAVAVQSDGKTLVAGRSTNGTDSDIVLIRFD